MSLLRPIEYLGTLSPTKRVLWCYLMWYLTMAWMHFDPSPRLWLTSLGIAVVIGMGLVFSVRGANAPRPDFWTLARLFLMPFCVSSFAALIKDRGFVVIFSPTLSENLVALGACALFLLLSGSLGLLHRAGAPVPAMETREVARVPGLAQAGGTQVPVRPDLARDHAQIAPEIED